jgi:hypothetical protein
MSDGAYFHRDQYGVLLRYPSPADARAHHRDQRPQVSDARRIHLIEAERELRVVKLIVDHGEFSDLAFTRIDDALSTIKRALNSLRPALGLRRQGFEG